MLPDRRKVMDYENVFSSAEVEDLSKGKMENDDLLKIFQRISFPKADIIAEWPPGELEPGQEERYIQKIILDSNYNPVDRSTTQTTFK